MQNINSKKCSQTAVWCSVTYLIKFWDVPVCFVNPPPPLFRAVHCYICSRRRVDVARYRMSCLVLNELNSPMVRRIRARKRTDLLNSILTACEVDGFYTTKFSMYSYWSVPWSVSGSWNPWANLSMTSSLKSKKQIIAISKFILCVLGQTRKSSAYIGIIQVFDSYECISMLSRYLYSHKGNLLCLTHNLHNT